MSKVDGEYPIAATQIHHTVMGRDSIVRETSLLTYLKGDRADFNPPHMLQRLNEHGHHEEAPLSEFDLWNAHPIEKVGHRWGMTIDLSSCIGCGNCLIACQSENNVPVVGKDEVRRGREMHWLRIDRYFASDEESAVGKKRDDDNFSYSKAEIAAKNPKVVHMPMMCHHCNHAPCETVCPVAATTHSNEGLNQMTYNRCIGTRYCANNCPYKVRRFNWFNYPSYKKFTEINPAQDDLGRMVLNPDVTVRTRGVMEKCSLCVQRIQSTKLAAKKEARTIVDGEFATACSESCPTNAIIVGDWNDSKSNILKSSGDKRAYQALEEVGIKPNIWYKVKVRNEEVQA
jgi:molybdopterin-containing oxidoreductase family iron-sulfur binding subunit